MNLFVPSLLHSLILLQKSNMLKMKSINSFYMKKVVILFVFTISLFFNPVVNFDYYNH